MGLDRGQISGLYGGLGSGLSGGINTGNFSGLLSENSKYLSPFIIRRNTLRAYYTFNYGDGSDYSGNLNHLLAYGTTTFSTGNWLKCADLLTTASGNGLTKNSSNILSSTTVPNITVSLWFKMNSTADDVSGFRFLELNTAAGAASPGVSLWILGLISGGMLQIYAFNNPNGNSSFTRTNFKQVDLNWHNIIVVKSNNPLLVNNTVKVYVDGTLLVTYLYSGADACLAGGAFISIGCRGAGFEQIMAQFDEVIVEEREWCDFDVQHYYKRMVSGKMPIIV